MMLNEAKKFSELVSLIYKRSPLQKKLISTSLSKMDEKFFNRAELFTSNLFSLMEDQKVNFEYAVDSYLELCKTLLVEQINFRKTGKYSCQSADEANENVYSSDKVMSSYMYGLALTQFLWINHYEMLNFFIDESSKLNNVESYLEIGPGHGIYLVEALKLFPRANFTAVDISPVAIKITKDIVEKCLPDAKCEFIVDSVNNLKEGRYDYIVMCEVLEHVDSPRDVLFTLHNLLSANGRTFVTTCANCPAVDHVYLFENVSHIRRELREANFEIITDLPLAVSENPRGDWNRENMEVNYAAILRKA